jgi:serine/threonine protein kinase
MQQTQDGQVLGTPTYMSPEQALGKDVDHRTDIFSVGVLLYRLITGQLPFDGGNFAEVVDRIVHAQPPAIARLNYDAPPELERITLKCLQKTPERRYQSAQELMIDLKNLRRDIESSDNPGHTQVSFVQPGNQGAGTQTAIQSPTVPDVTDPQHLGQSDVVITYAKLDDQPVMSGRQGWISQLRQNLHVRIAQLSGKEVTVVKQSDSSTSAEVEAEVLKQVPNAKTVISVLSPPFVQSDGCQRIVESFWKNAMDSGQFEAGDRTRLLNVIKTPAEADQLPPDLQSLYTTLVPYEFCFFRRICG